MRAPSEIIQNEIKLKMHFGELAKWQQTTNELSHQQRPRRDATSRSTFKAADPATPGTSPVKWPKNEKETKTRTCWKPCVAWPELWGQADSRTAGQAVNGDSIGTSAVQLYSCLPACLPVCLLPTGQSIAHTFACQFHVQWQKVIHLVISFFLHFCFLLFFGFFLWRLRR